MELCGEAGPLRSKASCSVVSQLGQRDTVNIQECVYELDLHLYSRTLTFETHSALCWVLNH